MAGTDIDSLEEAGIVDGRVEVDRDASTRDRAVVKELMSISWEVSVIRRRIACLLSVRLSDRSGDAFCAVHCETSCRNVCSSGSAPLSGRPLTVDSLALVSSSSWLHGTTTTAVRSRRVATLVAAGTSDPRRSSALARRESVGSRSARDWFHRTACAPVIGRSRTRTSRSHKARAVGQRGCESLREGIRPLGRL